MLETIHISGRLIARLITETLRGKTVPRILLNHALSSVELGGDILDLGSASNAASYNRFLSFKKPYTVTYTDINARGEGTIAVDLERPLSVKDASYGHITCFNTLEHIYNYQGLIRESYRVLKTGGTFVGGTPFLVNFHPDPNDYFRYTHEAIERMFTDAGFTPEKTVYLGLGPCIAAYSLQSVVIPRIFRPFFIFCSILFDLVILAAKKNQRHRYPLGYMYVLSKRVTSRQ